MFICNFPNFHFPFPNFPFPKFPFPIFQISISYSSNINFPFLNFHFPFSKFQVPVFQVFISNLPILAMAYPWHRTTFVVRAVSKILTTSYIVVTFFLMLPVRFAEQQVVWYFMWCMAATPSRTFGQKLKKYSKTVGAEKFTTFWVFYASSMSNVEVFFNTGKNPEFLNIILIFGPMCAVVLLQ